MPFHYLTASQINTRQTWVNTIANLQGTFRDVADVIGQSLAEEIQKQTLDSLLGHLRLCGVIPESYPHDSTQEKLYAKYTDYVIHEAYQQIGLKSVVLQERADSADVEGLAGDYGFVADAKAFRLSRSAKNQKDFKIQALNDWKYGKPFAMLVVPVYQLPTRSSQIYQQASTQSVCILTYTHLAVLVRYAHLVGQKKAIKLTQQLFDAVNALNPSKDAITYWQTVNWVLLAFDATISTLWQEEKQAVDEALQVAKQEALQVLADERQRIMSLTHAEAIQEVLRFHKIENREKIIQAVNNNTLLQLH